MVRRSVAAGRGAVNAHHCCAAFDEPAIPFRARNERGMVNPMRVWLTSRSDGATNNWGLRVDLR